MTPRAGVFAAYSYVGISIAMVLVGFAIVGAQLAQPDVAQVLAAGPLIYLAEVLKLALAVANVVLVIVWAKQLEPILPKAQAQLTTAAGFLAALFLVTSAMVGIIGVVLALSPTAGQVTIQSELGALLTAIANRTGLAAVVGDALWVLLMGVAGLRHGALPRPLAVLALITAACSVLVLVPTGSLYLLTFSIIWRIGLAIELRRRDSLTPTGSPGAASPGS